MAAAVLPGGYVLPQLFTSNGAITVGSPVFRSAANTIQTASDTNDATTQTKDVFGIYNGNSTGGDAATADATCTVAIGPCEVNGGNAITPGDMVTASFSATAGRTECKAGLAPVTDDTFLGMAIGEGAAAGKVAIDVRPTFITHRA
mgnify:CR=1 FL=1|tara:strand:+ start:746 stop:1183 length:438 start_codon:yes stop_codon:yes gene_type:complete